MLRTSFAACFALATVPAFAGNLNPPAPEPVIVAPAPVAAAPSTDWSGAYFGLQYDTITSGDLIQSLAPFDVEGQVYGIFAGYRRDFGRFVLGGEIDYMMGDGDITDGAGNVTAVDYDSLMRIGIEGGIDAGRALIYGTAGWADIDISVGPGSLDSSGYFYGVGVDFLATDRIIVGVEALRHHFSDFGGTAVSSELDVTTLGVNVGWRF